MQEVQSILLKLLFRIEDQSQSSSNLIQSGLPSNYVYLHTFDYFVHKLFVLNILVSKLLIFKLIVIKLIAIKLPVFKLFNVQTFHLMTFFTLWGLKM